MVLLTSLAAAAAAAGVAGCSGSCRASRAAATNATCLPSTTRTSRPATSSTSCREWSLSRPASATASSREPFGLQVALVWWLARPPPVGDDPGSNLTADGCVFLALGTGCALLQCLGQLSLASLRGRLAEYQLRLGTGGNVTSVGWQVTLCDPVWHVSSRSGEAGLLTKREPLCTAFTFLLYFT